PPLSPPRRSSALTPRRGVAPLARGRIGGQHASFDLEARRLRLAFAQKATLLLARQLRQLRAVHAQVVLLPGRDRARTTRQRRHREPDRNQCHQPEGKPQAHSASSSISARPALGVRTRRGNADVAARTRTLANQTWAGARAIGPAAPVLRTARAPSFDESFGRRTVAAT